MSRKGTYSKKKFIFDAPELVQKLRQSRTNYDYPTLKMKDILGDWVVLETFVTDIKTGFTRKDRPSILMIISTLQDPGDPDSDRTWAKFKVFSGSSRINNFLLGLRDSDQELTYLPLVLRFIEVPFTDKKTGLQKIRYEIDSGLDGGKLPPPAIDTEI